MAQVRKLKNGESIPKAQNKYKYILDNQEVYLTDDNLNTINDRIAALPAKYKRFLGNATEAIKSGEESGNRADNTVTMNQLSGLNRSNERRLEKQKPSTIEALFHTDSYDAKEAINEYLKIINDVANTKPSKKKIDSSSISLDFNEDESGNKYLSSTAGENLSARSRIATVLEQLNAGDASEYDLSAYDSIRDWMNGLDGEDKYKAATDYLTDLWTRMGAAGYAYNPDDEDFLRNFGIIYGLSKPTIETTTAAKTPIVVETPATKSSVTESSIIDPTDNNQDNNNAVSISAQNNRNSNIIIPQEVVENVNPILATPGKEESLNLPRTREEFRDIKKQKLPLVYDRYTDGNKSINATFVRDVVSRNKHYKLVLSDKGVYYLISPDGKISRSNPGDASERIYNRGSNKWWTYLGGEFIPFLQKIDNSGGNILEKIPSVYKLEHLPDTFNLYLDDFKKGRLPGYKGVNFKWGVRSNKQGGVIKAQSGAILPEALVWDYKKPMPSLNGRDTEWERFITKRIGIAGLKDPGLHGTPTTGLLNPNPADIPTAQATTNSNGLLNDRTNYLRRLSSTAMSLQKGPDITMAPSVASTTVGSILDNRPSTQSILERSSNITSQNGTKGGGYTKNLSGMSILPLISAGRFALTSHFQNKYNRQGKAAIEAGRYHEIAPILNAPTTDNPILDRALRNIQSERMIGIKPVTSDYIQNNAIKQQRESQLFDRERELTGQRSQDYTDKLNQILAVNNQNINAATQVANANRARDAAIDSAKLQQDQILTQQRAQSWDNLGLEAETNLKNDLDILRTLERNRFVTNQTKAYQDALKGRIGDDLYNQWENLGTKQDEYDDIIDWLYKTNKSEYDSRGIGTWNKEQIQNMRDRIDQWDANNVRTYFNIRPDGWLSNLLFGKTSSIGIARKGGTLRGNTRYKNEPDEQIWIDNNKATQQAIAKLSDNVIKLLLRALK